MPWREVTLGETRWTVAPVAERNPDAHGWRLMLNCRASGRPGRAVWAATGLQAGSRSDLFLQADRLSEARLRAALAEQIDRS